MPDTEIGNLPAVSAVVATHKFPCDEAGVTKYATAQQIQDFNRRYWIRQAADRTLTNSTAEQKLFDSVTNGRLTLPVGVYTFELVMYLSSMSGTSGNCAFDILGAGTATLVDVLQHVVGADAAAPTVGAQSGQIAIQGQSAASMVTAGTATAIGVSIRGTFEVSVTGTIIPSVTLVTAAAAVVRAGTYFECEYKGPANDVSHGPWD